MAYRKNTIRELAGPGSRKAARLINNLESTLTKLKNLMPIIETMESYSILLYRRLSAYEKQVFDQERKAAEIVTTTEGAETLPASPLFTQTAIKPICQFCAKPCKDEVNDELTNTCAYFEKQVESPQ